MKIWVVFYSGEGAPSEIKSAHYIEAEAIAEAKRLDQVLLDKHNKGHAIYGWAPYTSLSWEGHDVGETELTSKDHGP